MYDIKEDSFFLNKMAVLTKSTENYYTYTILPEHGEGTYTIYKIIPGLYISLNNYIVNSKIINNANKYKLYSNTILKIDYCLEGKVLVNDNNSKVCISGKGNTSYYAGTENIYSVEHFNKHYESITIFGYIDQVTDVFEEIFKIKKSMFFDFCKLINNEKEYIVIKNDAVVIRLVNEIKEAFEKCENERVRLKVIELLLYELKNFKINLRNKEVYYNRATIDKIVNIEMYIMKNLDKKITITTLSEKFNISSDMLKRCFKQMYSCSIYAYVKKSRLEKGKHLLENSDESVTEIALSCGYNNHHSFSKAFKEQYKISPREIRKAYKII